MLHFQFQPTTLRDPANPEGPVIAGVVLNLVLTIPVSDADNLVKKLQQTGTMAIMQASAANEPPQPEVVEGELMSDPNTEHAEF